MATKRNASFVRDEDNAAPMKKSPSIRKPRSGGLTNKKIDWHILFLTKVSYIVK